MHMQMVFITYVSLFMYIIQLKQHYAPINVKPHPTQYGDGWGITKGFDAKFRPKGGAFDLN